MTNSSIAERATALMRSASLRIANDFPFHACLLSRFTMHTSTTTSSIALQLTGLSLSLTFNPAFVAPLSVENCEALLLHVLNHAVFGHLTMTPQEFPHARALAIAQDITANEWIGERELPRGAITLASFPDFPPGEDVTERYARLCALPKRDLQGLEPVDDHDPEDTDVGPHQETLRTVVAADVEAALEELNQDEFSRMPDAFRDALKKAGHEPGTGSGDDVSSIVPRQATISWQAALRAYVARLMQREATYMRPSRRAPDLVGVVPGMGRTPERHTIVAAIDTSASMTDDDLCVIAGELTRLRRSADIHVIECDTTIRREYEFVGSLPCVTGRGGTDLRPPFARAAKIRPDLLIYFTDGFGSAPERWPPFPTVWCLTSSGTRPAKWGRVLRMTSRGR